MVRTLEDNLFRLDTLSRQREEAAQKHEKLITYYERISVNAAENPIAAENLTITLFEWREYDVLIKMLMMEIEGGL